MKVMHVSEFEQWLKESGCRDFWLDSDNIGFGLDCMEITQHYSSVSVSRFYDRLLFRSTTGTLLLDGVKEVHMHEKLGEVGTVFDVICRPDIGNFKIWRFLAD